MQPGLFRELIVDPFEIASAVRRQERASVDLFLAPSEQRAEDPRGLPIPGEDAERLDVGEADELSCFGSVSQCLAGIPWPMIRPVTETNW